MLLIALYTLLEPGPFHGPEVSGELLFDGGQPSQYMRRFCEDDLLHLLQLIDLTDSKDLS